MSSEDRIQTTATYLQNFIGLKNTLPADGDFLVVHEEHVDPDSRVAGGGGGLALLGRRRHRRPRLHLRGEEEPVEGDAVGDASVLQQVMNDDSFNLNRTQSQTTSTYTQLHKGHFRGLETFLRKLRGQNYSTIRRKVRRGQLG